MLVGCGYFDAPEPVLEKPVEEVETVPYEPVNVEDAVSRSTKGAVQLYGWDDVEPVSNDVAPVETDEVSSYEMDQQKLEQSYDAAEVDAAQAVGVNERGYAPVTTLESSSMPSSGAVYAADPSVQIFPFDDMPVALTAQSYNAPVMPAKEEDIAVISSRQGNMVTVYFDHDSAQLSGAALDTVSSVAREFNAASGQGLTVAGHASVRANYADEAQKRIVNLKVSMDRAFSVAKALIAQGVPADFIRVMGFGDTLPPPNLDGKSADEAARRVEISR